MPFDLYYFPLVLQAGRPLSEYPGLIAFPPTKRPARGRQFNLLSAMLTLVGDSTLAPAVINSLLQKMADEFYSTPGTVTSALRAAADQINGALLDINLHSPSGQLVGLLNLAVLHGETAYIAHVGPTHTLALSAAWIQNFTDAQGAGRGLGVSRSTTVRFFQTEINPGDLLVMCAEPPQSWTETALAGSPALTLDALRRRLVSQAGPSLLAGVVQFQNGKNLVHALRPRLTPAAPIAGPVVQVETPVPEVKTLSPEPAVTPAVIPAEKPVESQQISPAAQAVPSQSVPAEVRTVPSTAPARSEPEPEPLPAVTSTKIVENIPAQTPVPAARPNLDALEQARLAQELSGGKSAVYLSGEKIEPRTGQAAATAAPAPVSARGTRAERRRGNSAWKKPLANAWFSIKTWRQKAGSALQRFAGQLLPIETSESGGLTHGTMLFIAIAVPVVVVTVAVAVYFQSGRSTQHREYLTLAQQSIDAAVSEADALTRRGDWAQALAYLDAAEKYGKSDESVGLRAQAVSALDALDLVERLEFVPTDATGFGANVNITKIVANNTDIFLLDGEQGRVFRMFMTQQGYEIDPNFNCSPGPSGGIYISKIVDINIVPPISDNRATLMAVDSGGVQVFCSTVNDPISVMLTPPDTGWGKIQAVSYISSHLFVLDPLNNAVFKYNGSGVSFSGSPVTVFKAEVPNLANVIGMATSDDYIYLLHDSGEVTRCAIYDFQDKQCDDPAPFEDLRPGHELNPLTLPDANFTQIMTTSQTDPSLYLMDPTGPVVYHLTLKQSLVRLLQPDTTTDSGLPNRDATAYTVTPNQRLVIAFGNRVYYALLR